MTAQPAAIVTGSSRGIGRAIAVELGRLGYAVTVNYASNRKAADEVVAKIEGSGSAAIAVEGDVGCTEDRAHLVQQTRSQFGRLDLLVNNAGITSPGRRDLLEATEQSWDRVFDTNLKGPFFLAQQCANAMIELIGNRTIAHGKIINVSSISAYAVSTNRVDYCLTKAASEMMTHLLAVRLAEEKISVFEICPGVIRSDMTAPVQEKYDQAIRDGLMPMRRWGEPEDVARAVAAIVGDYFPYTTGQRFHVDGGFHIRRL